MSDDDKEKKVVITHYKPAPLPKKSAAKKAPAIKSAPKTKPPRRSK